VICTSEVVASNGLSQIHSLLNISVLPAMPQNLTVALVTEAAPELSHCRPYIASSASRRHHHVYSSVPVTFEAYLSISANLMFHWSIVSENMSRSETVDEMNLAVDGVQCHRGQSCTSSVQVCSPHSVLSGALWGIVLIY